MIQVGRSVVHCPYCKGELDDPRRLVACAPCGARHHLECYRELGHCASCSSWEKLVHRAAAEYEVARAEKLVRRTIVSVLVILPLACVVTWLLTVDRNANALPSAMKCAQESLAQELSDVAREAREVADAKANVASTLEATRARLLAENRSWLEDRAHVLEETAREKELSRKLARQGWHVAELVASATLVDSSSSLDKLKQAERLLPEGPSVLRGNIRARMDELWHPPVFMGTLVAKPGDTGRER